MKRTLSLPCISEVVKRIHGMLMLLTSKTFACMQGHLTFMRSKLKYAAIELLFLLEEFKR